ncbi:MAG: hypothetical protein VX899_03795 [Myxococcota bacterium]|nr:hypothetical protein [Myxococcota bacterium]
MLAALLFWFSLLFSPAQAQSWEAAPSVDTSVALEPMPALPGEYRAFVGTYATVYARNSDRAAADQVLALTETRIPTLAQRLGVGTGRSMDIVLAHDDREFHSLQPGKTHDWAEGTAWPHRSLIYLHAPGARAGTAEPLAQVLDHELIHVLLGRAFGERRVPTWLQEGLAQYYAGEISPQLPERIARGMVGGGLLSLEDLSYGFPRDPRRADLAYAQSADLINWIASEHGEPGLQVLVAEMARGQTMNASLRAATGLGAVELEERWLERFQDSGLWLAAFAAEGSFFALMVPLMLLGAVRLRRERQATLARWEDEERRQDALIEQLRQWGLPTEHLRGQVPHT